MAALQIQGVREFKVRAGQREFERGVMQHRISGLLARRQYGKTTIASRIALKKMMKFAGHTVIFGSVKVDLGREIVRKESEAMQKAFRMLAEMAKGGGQLLNLANSETGKEIRDVLSADDFAELYEATRLEFRLHHSNSVYSRTKVVALTPDAVGETGDLILDEVGRAKRFREVLEAMLPIIASNPEFRAIFTTTPPPDDGHPSYDLLAPPVGTELPISPTGNWYKSELGVHVLRITAEDAYADGIPLYDDDTGAPIAPEESRRRASDKDAWDRNYGCQFVLGGTSACGLIQLDTAQRRGVGHCHFFVINSDLDFEVAVHWIAENLTAGPVGLGWDLATTTNATSNPSSFSFVEGQGIEKIIRSIVIWKTADPDVAMDRATRLVKAVAARKAGGPARKLSIDASNERYFAQSARKILSEFVPVELVVASESVELPGNPEPLNRKQHLGGLLVAELHDNHLLVPPERYVRDDWRLVKKEKGQFVCLPDTDGKHGDTFDSSKLGLWSLVSDIMAGFFIPQATTYHTPRQASRRERSCGV